MPNTYDKMYRGYSINANANKKQGCDTDILDAHIERTEDMINRHNKVFGCRVDLGYRTDRDPSMVNKDISEVIAVTRRYFKRRGVDTSVSWRYEHGDGGLPHVHVSVLADGNKIMAPEQINKKLEEGWTRQVGEDNARVHYCEKCYRMRRNKPDCDRVIDDWIYRSSYLAKVRDRGNSPKRHHEHGGTRVKKK